MSQGNSSSGLAGLALIGSFVSAFGQIQAGKAAERASILNAFSMETDADLDRVQAAQQMNAIMQEYDDASSSNIATLAAAGRDVGSDRSVKAFMERQKEIVGTDAKRLLDQSQLRLLQGRQQAAAERTSGRAARRASRYSAISTITSGVSNYEQTR